MHYLISGLWWMFFIWWGVSHLPIGQRGIEALLRLALRKAERAWRTFMQGW